MKQKGVPRKQKGVPTNCEKISVLYVHNWNEEEDKMRQMKHIKKQYAWIFQN